MQFATRAVNCRICKEIKDTDLPRNDICPTCVEVLDKRYPRLTTRIRRDIFVRAFNKEVVYVNHTIAG